MCTSSSSSLASAATGCFSPRIIHPHKPEIMCITCIDGREAAGRYFEFDDSAIRITEIGSVIPPYEKAPISLRAKFNFMKLKEISDIKVVGHSFCGGAETVIANPDPCQIDNDDVRGIVESIGQSGADLIRLRNVFMSVAEGNMVHAANLLSRHLTLVSLANISTYPGVSDMCREKKIDLIPLYHVMKQGSGEMSRLERYDVGLQRWLRADLSEEMTTHMCRRPFNCGSCNSCGDTIEASLRWTGVEYMMDDGRPGMMDVPVHAAGLLRERRDFYQPALHALQAAKIQPPGL